MKTSFGHVDIVACDKNHAYSFEANAVKSEHVIYELNFHIKEF